MTTEQRIARLLDWLDNADFNPNTVPWLKEVVETSIWMPIKAKNTKVPITLKEFYSWDHHWDEDSAKLYLRFEFVAVPYGQVADITDYERPAVAFTIFLDAQEVIDHTINHSKMKFYEAIYLKFLAHTDICEITPEFEVLYGKSKTSI